MVKIDFEPVLAVAKAIGQLNQNCMISANAVANWNNDPDQTAENVALTLEYAALLAEQDTLVSSPRLVPELTPA
jgi:hypothetical protein